MKGSARGFVLASVLLNMLMGGVIAGHLLHRARPAIVTVSALEALPVEQRAALEEKFASITKDTKEGWRVTREYREESLNILTAAQFDADAYDAVTRKAETAMQQNQTRRADAIKTMAKAFAPEERKALAAWLRESYAQWKKGQDCLQGKSKPADAARSER